MGRKGLLIAGLALAVLGAAGIWAWRRVAPYPQVGGVYLAQQMCACVFVTGRSEGACRDEFQPDIRRFHVRVTRQGADRGAVETRLLIFQGASRYERAYGCTIAR